MAMAIAIKSCICQVRTSITSVSSGGTAVALGTTTPLCRAELGFVSATVADSRVLRTASVAIGRGNRPLDGRRNRDTTVIVPSVRVSCSRIGAKRLAMCLPRGGGGARVSIAIPNLGSNGPVAGSNRAVSAAPGRVIVFRHSASYDRRRCGTSKFYRTYNTCRRPGG